MTKNKVEGLNGVTVWLIAGEGERSPKSFYLASKFLANACEQGKWPGTQLPNCISGDGKLYKLTKPLSRELERDLKQTSNMFRNGFMEIHDADVIDKLESMT